MYDTVDESLKLFFYNIPAKCSKYMSIHIQVSTSMYLAIQNKCIKKTQHINVYTRHACKAN